jgi:hypothetical protein
MRGMPDPPRDEDQYHPRDHEERPMPIERNRFLAMYGQTLEPEDWMPLYNEAVELEALFAWVEAGFPPWSCEHCVGSGISGPEQGACAACKGTGATEPPPRAQRVKAVYDRIWSALLDTTRELLSGANDEQLPDRGEIINYAEDAVKRAFDAEPVGADGLWLIGDERRAEGQQLLEELRREPDVQCTQCFRKSWSASEPVGSDCAMPQPTRLRCLGILRPITRVDIVIEVDGKAIMEGTVTQRPVDPLQ